MQNCNSKIKSYKRLVMIFLLAFLVLFAHPREASAFKREFIKTAGSGSWTVPSDWSDTNVLEAIGPGGGGRTGGNSGSGGGGGGAYSVATNVSGLSGSLSYVVGAGGTPSGDGADTWLGASGTTCSAVTMSVCADRGRQGSGGSQTAGLGGDVANNVPANAGFSGGTGGAGTGTGDNGGGGGGAGGNGTAGNSQGGDGANYGGGAGGGELLGGTGGQGIIVITYIPSVSYSARTIRLMGGVRLRGGIRLLLEDKIKIALTNFSLWHTAQKKS